MKQIFLIAGVLTVMLLFHEEFQKTDIAVLEPVQIVSVRTENNRIMLKTDTGAFGTGSSIPYALIDLKSTAKGNVFLTTAECVLVNTQSVPKISELKQLVRPGCLICICDELVDLKEASVYLTTHEPNTTLNDYVTGAKELDTLTVRRGRMELVEGTE